MPGVKKTTKTKGKEEAPVSSKRAKNSKDNDAEEDFDEKVLHKPTTSKAKSKPTDVKMQKKDVPAKKGKGAKKLLSESSEQDDVEEVLKAALLAKGSVNSEDRVVDQDELRKGREEREKYSKIQKEIEVERKAIGETVKKISELIENRESSAEINTAAKTFANIQYETRVLEQMVEEVSKTKNLVVFTKIQNQIGKLKNGDYTLSDDEDSD